MNKARNKNLLKLADDALNEQVSNASYGVSKILNGLDIEASYNGSIASLGVSIAMCGLLPSLVIYYQDKVNSGSKPKVNRRSVLDVVARIMAKDNPEKWKFKDDYARELLKNAIESKSNNSDVLLKREVVDAVIALKQVVRTYNLK